jgi:hypothetical protein
MLLCFSCSITCPLLPCAGSSGAYSERGGPAGPSRSTQGDYSRLRGIIRAQKETMQVRCTCALRECTLPTPACRVVQLARVPHSCAAASRGLTHSAATAPATLPLLHQGLRFLCLQALEAEAGHFKDKHAKLETGHRLELARLKKEADYHKKLRQSADARSYDLEDQLARLQLQVQRLTKVRNGDSSACAWADNECEDLHVPGSLHDCGPTHHGAATASPSLEHSLNTAPAGTRRGLQT